MKVVIVGNSGSGKTWLANEISQSLSIPKVSLDDLFWQQGGYTQKRDTREINYLINESKKELAWIVEGVFGELAKEYLDIADCLIWLDLEWNICKQRILNRARENAQEPYYKQTEQSLNALLQWAEQYYERRDLRSYLGHKKLFEMFDRNKYHFQSENSVNNFFFYFVKK
ncbi:AAA family ATPase [Zooshikella harenae]|uniref:AAA family ATPase n=1 Tax=Zooshikella harenae TaxID=2827238 RepID=A0ABS5ZG11_9GAMM|nr:AAA family ATPase [Zooshikella harenae]MBU2712991.1 hypothetical protein [Zooshikella harenae]